MPTEYKPLTIHVGEVAVQYCLSGSTEGLEDRDLEMEVYLLGPTTFGTVVDGRIVADSEVSEDIKTLFGQLISHHAENSDQPILYPVRILFEVADNGR